MDFVNLNENVLVVTKTPLAGNTLSNLIRLLILNKFKVDTRYLPRLLYALTMSSVMSPFRLIDQIKYDEEINKTKIKHDPLFILGHWRSGTTYLHNVLSIDNNMGYFSTFQALLPGLFLGFEKFFKPLVIPSIPKKRLQDDVSLDVDLPQEEEFAISALTPYSTNHGLCFPRNAELFTRFVCMDNVTKKELMEWKAIYLYIIKKMTVYSNGKQLVLKNPANTGRIKLLLEMFPNAKFIHIHRNPYYVYLSTMRLLMTLIPFQCLQKPQTVVEVEKQMIRVYKQMYIKYFNEKKLIPKGNLIEISYEDFIKNPLKTLKQIYSELKLDGFNSSEKKFAEYIRFQSKVKKHRYAIGEDIKKKVYENWDFAFDELGYNQ